MTLLERAEAVWMVAAAAKSLQSCLTLFDPIDGSQSGSPIPGILQARTLVWVAISFSNAWRWKVKVKSLSRVRLLATPWAAAYLAPPSMGFSRQEYWSGVPLLLKIKSCLLRGFLSCPSGSRDLCHVDAYVCILRGSKEPWSESPGCWAQKCHLPAMISVCQYPWDIYPQPRPELQICGSSCFHAWFHGLPCVSLNFPGALPPWNWAHLSQRLYPQHLGFIRICNVTSISSWKSSLTLLHPLLVYILISCPFPAPLQCSPAISSSAYLSFTFSQQWKTWGSWLCLHYPIPSALSWHVFGHRMYLLTRLVTKCINEWINEWIIE